MRASDSAQALPLLLICYVCDIMLKHSQQTPLLKLELKGKTEVTAIAHTCNQMIVKYSDISKY